MVSDTIKEQLTGHISINIFGLNLDLLSKLSGSFFSYSVGIH